MSLHSFDPNIAAKVGVNAAVIYQNLVFWAEKNKANQRHIKDGYVWTYNSRRAFSELFPYLSESQVKTAIKKLVDMGLVVKGEYNNAMYDRTNWYSPAITADWVSSAIGQKPPMDWTDISNGLDENDQPIPDSKPYTKPDDIGPKPKPKQKRAVSLPENWVPSDRNIDDAIKAGLSQQDIDHEANQFLNHAIANDRKQKDWDAAWRMWVGKSKQFSANRRMASNQSSNGYGQGGGLAGAYARRHLGS